MTIADLEQILLAAQQNVRIVDDECTAAIMIEKRRIQGEFRDRRVAADQMVIAAQKAFDDAKIAATKTDPLVGKKVFKIERKPVSIYSRRYHDVKVFGIIEVMTKDTIIPLNKSWGIPKAGQLFVRLLKKDGTEGARIDTYLPAWKEVEGQ